MRDERLLFLSGNDKRRSIFFYFWYGQAVFSKTAAVPPELYIFYGSDKQPIVLTALLFEWQAFIGRYP